MTKRPFTIAIPDDDIADLGRRLAAARWPAPYEDDGWDAGTSHAFLRDLITRWRDHYDWREREAALNGFRHCLADVDGVQLHFIEASGRSPASVPLLVMGGWPSSFVQMLDLIPLLTHPSNEADLSFHVIVASLPGYPFTSLNLSPRTNYAVMADLMCKLMVDVLGYETFAVRGSDQGGLVLQQLGLRHPQRLIGLHRSGITPFANPLPPDLGPAEIAYQKDVAAWAQRETAYAQLQALRPETLSPALADSPLALASWFIEKFQRWGDVRDGLDATFGIDRLLDNLSLHWFTGSAAAATRLYRNARLDPGSTGRVMVPTAVLMPLHDGVTVPAPVEWCMRSYNVVRFTEMERGGHFAEWEVPKLVADDIRAFFTELTGP
jgi:pimeloyl-ACP methyl ester carboxylesterase